MKIVYIIENNVMVGSLEKLYILELNFQCHNTFFGTGNQHTILNADNTNGGSIILESYITLSRK